MSSIAEIKINLFNQIPLTLPRELILARLGYREGLTNLDDRQKKILEQNMMRGFSLCEPRGVWSIIEITHKDDQQIKLITGDVFNSKALAKMLRSSKAVVLMAATAGKEIIEESNKEISHGDPAQGVILDATGSVVADASLNWIHKSIDKTITARSGEHITKARFSPGYADLDLSNQKIIYDLLQLNNIGISITAKLMLIPEKSVIGIAGIESIH